MALSRDVDDVKVSLKCMKAGGQVYELATTGPITLTRSQNTASKLTAKVLRDGITVEKSDTIDLILNDEHHQFFGIVIDTTKEDSWCSITAYDQLWFWNKNKKRMCYENITLKELVARVATDRGYPFTDDGMEDTIFKLPARVEENTTDLAIVTNGIQSTFEATTVKYFIWDDAGFVRLNSTNWLAGECNMIVEPAYFESYSYSETMEDGASVVRLEEKITEKPVEDTTKKKEENKDQPKTASIGIMPISGGGDIPPGEDKEPETPDPPKEPDPQPQPDPPKEEEKDDKKKKSKAKTEPTIKTYLVRDDAANTKYGTIEYVGDVGEGENGQAKAEAILKEQVANFEKPKLSISGCQGDITVRGGTPVLVDFFSAARKEYIRGWCEVDTVTHTIENGYHSMDFTGVIFKSLDDWDNTDPNYYSHPALNQ